MTLKQIIKNGIKILKIVSFILKYRNDERVKPKIAILESKKLEIAAIKNMKKHAKEIAEEINEEVNEIIEE